MILGPSGARGIVGEDFNPEQIIRLLRAFLRVLPEKRKRRIVVGRDTRPSGKYIAEVVRSAGCLLGYDVIDIGVSPTPCVQFAVGYYRAAGGVIITASHNPPQWNALKFLGRDGSFLSAAVVRKLISCFHSGKGAAWRGFRLLGNPVTTRDHEEAFLEKVLRLVDVSVIRKARFNVLLDSNGGAGGALGTRLLKRLGCRTREVGTGMDGRFLHPTEPTVANLSRTAALVKRGDFHIGFCQDPDADRLVIIDENGRVPREDSTLALAVQDVLSRRRRSSGRKPAVVVNLSTSLLVRDVVERFGGRIHQSKVGETFVVQEMRRRGAVVGGEGNGGVIHPSVHYGRDSLVGMALILNLLAREKKPPSEILSEYPEYHIVKTKRALRDKNQFSKVAEKLVPEQGERRDSRDGIKISGEDYWVQVRVSNTEPIMRIMAEARDEKKLKKILKRL